MATEMCPTRPESSLTFTQGLIVGQISVVLVVVAFIKYFILGDTPSSEVTATIRAAERRSRTLAHKRSLLLQRESRQQSLGPDGPLQQPSLNKKKSAILRGPPPAQANIGAILNKTYYRVDSHQPESLDWFNVLVAQTIAQFRSDAQHDDAILLSLSKALNGPVRPDFIDEIKVTELSLGDDFPIFSNCRIIPVDEDGLDLNPRERERDYYPTHPHTPRRRQPHHSHDDPAAYIAAAGPGARLQARMDVDLSDMITMAIETKLVLNYPQARTAVLPVALSVSVVRFSGTLRISFIPSNPSTATPTMMTFSFLDDYRLDLSMRSLMGSRSRLQDVPKIAQLIEARLHRWFDERAVEPRFQEIELPSLWPRKKNTRGPDSNTGATDAGSSGVGGSSNMGETASGTSGSMGRAKGKDIARELRDEARKEVEAEIGVRSDREPNHLRLRRRHLGDLGDDEFSMPGSLPST
ncbi:hypothetical protein MKZ38_003450 [Zalerion maritima]|uniref:Maintenance of mitochondrial morphology protein 1 n=1 Tax=Zalerion maritima TaxID=339359 RepID=A0AAD5RP53_9PEZI|nr:hypothetical protein MKZ38_003450 [Zalerion maritima]